MSDVITFLILSTITYFFFNGTIQKLDNKIKLSLIFCVFSVFFFNDFAFSHSKFPDQNKALNFAKDIRNFIFIIDDQFPGTWWIAFLFSLAPVPIKSVLSLSIINKFFYLWTILYLKKKNFLSNIFIYFLVFFPSLALYSSLALKETVVIIFFVMGVYYLKNNNYYKLLIVLVLLFLVRHLHFYFYICFLISYIFMFNLNISKKAKLLFIFFSTLIFFSIFHESFLNYFNYKRLGYFSESFGYNFEFADSFYQNSKVIKYDFNSLIELLINTSKSFVFPTVIFDSLIGLKLTKINFFLLIIFLENLFSMFLIFYLFIFFLNKNIPLVLFNFIFYFFIIFLISNVAFNELTILRYKLSFLILYFTSFLFIKSKS